MNQDKKIIFLPEELVNLLIPDEREKLINETKTLIRVDFKVLVSTTKNEDRYRELDDYDVTIETILSDTCRSETQSYIYLNMHDDCPWGKYPWIYLTGVLCEDYTEYIYDDFCGHVWIFLHD